MLTKLISIIQSVSECSGIFVLLPRLSSTFYSYLWVIVSVCAYVAFVPELLLLTQWKLWQLKVRPGLRVFRFITSSRFAHSWIAFVSGISFRLCWTDMNFYKFGGCLENASYKLSWQKNGIDWFITFVETRWISAFNWNKKWWKTAGPECVKIEVVKKEEKFKIKREDIAWKCSCQCEKD